MYPLNDIEDIAGITFPKAVAEADQFETVRGSEVAVHTGTKRETPQEKVMAPVRRLGRGSGIVVSSLRVWDGIHLGRACRSHRSPGSEEEIRVVLRWLNSFLGIYARRSPRLSQTSVLHEAPFVFVIAIPRQRRLLSLCISSRCLHRVVWGYRLVFQSVCHLRRVWRATIEFSARYSSHNRFQLLPENSVNFLPTPKTRPI